YADAEATLAAKAELYATWPDYLQLKAATKVDVTQEDFTFDLVSTGSRPNLDLANIYEPLEKDETILAFDYTAEQDIENGVIMYNTPQLMTDVREQLATLPATSEMTTVYVNVAKGIKQLGFGTAVDHGIRWYINYNAGAEDVLKLVAQNFRFITKAEMKAAGGKPLNGEVGDVNDDGDVSIADGVAVLNAMAGQDVPGDADVNGDGDISIADFVAVLNIMAGQGQ
ncbi:MAG: dockerin type I repeat-containing protein, partial [Prevotella sp.]|nr:dockerin type I repeat-containing protein [Prevotella sp.]